MSIVRQAAAILLLATALPALGGIYSYTDAEGNRVFTDRPTGQAMEEVQLKPSNSMAAQPTPAPRVVQPPKPQEATIRYQLQILSPAADEAIRNNAGSVSVTVQAEPALQPGHAYQVLLDGQPFGAPGEETTFELNNVDRGTHQLAVAVVDAQERVLQQSESLSFHLIRTSLAQRRMVNPCKKADYGVRPECPLKDKPVEKRDIPFVPFL
ncbi:DUF4124 domain-containing protein [Pseudomonas songnenensis]|uniref:DUF4124 domain-containing protein n=1 Tax=Pseudomonas songnenensis TaxID=1176259 RepID=A0ABX9UUP9_9PSED|nr:DUF4124 domain-containing protein [Pseudomonas songnenensis]MCQ4298412.1 DUF4124 domain-containing protein [Pseudomonas songnenensis]RMH96748.1 DUF4124 domain-containing protein [Pseudomonas songnenensis]